ncbi:MAG TPA: Xaa-Pro peptidase family protein [Vicinamibacterales bacterium]|nr:Xaa-Pro peptidase family protein [Vicinamibacterales bacterium]
MRRVSIAAIMLLVVAGSGGRAQPVFTGAEIFPPEEFAARRAKIFDAIGDAVAALQGTAERPGEQPLRQNNQFFYLTGVVEPRALLWLDGRTRRATIYLQPNDERRQRQIERMYGVGLVPGAEAARTTGLDAALPRAEFAAAVADAGRQRTTIYTTFRPEVLGSASAGEPAALARATAADPWDGRASREDTFVAKLKAAAPHCTVRDLDPAIDALRAIKSPREIAVIREATRLAGLGIVEAMRDARPGLFEYQLQADAEFVFKDGGAYGPAYFALIATGPNTLYSHYHKNTAALQDGDLVQFDYAPDYNYYASDVTRVFPANGRFSPRQRELYSIYLQLYRALMTSIAVHASPRDIVTAAVAKMDAAMAAYQFTDAEIRAAAAQFVDGYRTRRTVTSLGHSVGMEVHDVGGPPATLEPGMIFTIEPPLQLPDEHIGLRLEDMILITDAGYENLSASVPFEIDAVERTMKEPGLRSARPRR